MRIVSLSWHEYPFLTRKSRMFRWRQRSKIRCASSTGWSALPWKFICMLLVRRAATHRPANTSFNSMRSLPHGKGQRAGDRNSPQVSGRRLSSDRCRRTRLCVPALSQLTVTRTSAPGAACPHNSTSACCWSTMPDAKCDGSSRLCAPAKDAQSPNSTIMKSRFIGYLLFSGNENSSPLGIFTSMLLSSLTI